MSQTAGIEFGAARQDELLTIVKMLANDSLGANREMPAEPLADSYRQAFEAIDRDANNELIVGRQNGQVLAVMQLTYIPYLTYGGAWRAMIEGVRVHERCRGSGLGQTMIELAIEKARQRNCRLVQLTSNKARSDAIRFYQRLGFECSHEGFKLDLASG